MPNKYDFIISLGSALGAIISAIMASRSVTYIKKENKYKEVQTKETKRHYLLNYETEINYIKATLDSIAIGKQYNESNAIGISIKNVYNIKFPTPIEYAQYFDYEASDALRKIRTSVLEHYSLHWYSNETNSFSDENYIKNKIVVMYDAKKRLKVINESVIIIKKLLKEYDKNK